MVPRSDFRDMVSKNTDAHPHSGKLLTLPDSSSTRTHLERRGAESSEQNAKQILGLDHEGGNPPTEHNLFVRRRAENFPTVRCPLRSDIRKIGTIQRRLAWPLHKDDTLFQSGRPSGLNIYAPFCYEFECAPLAIRRLMGSPGPIISNLQDPRKFLKHGPAQYLPNVAPPNESRSKIFFAQAHGVDCASTPSTHRFPCP